MLLVTLANIFYADEFERKFNADDDDYDDDYDDDDDDDDDDEDKVVTRMVLTFN